MPYSFEGKVILITGAGSGIGCSIILHFSTNPSPSNDKPEEESKKEQQLSRATAIKLSRLHATLALCDINYDALSSTSKLLAPNTPQHLDDVDVSSSQEVTKFVKDTIAKFKTITHVFNCAGINPTSMPIGSTPDAYFDSLVSVNLKGIFLVTKAVSEYLGEGSAVVNVSSVSGIRPSAQQGVYGMTKAGVVAFSKSMALELGPRGVRTNVVAPGYVDTPTNAGVVKGGEAVERMVNGNALGRLGTPEEVADVVAFLFSDESRYMNGAVVEIDGMLKMTTSVTAKS